LHIINDAKEKILEERNEKDRVNEIKNDIDEDDDYE
jgi:hypothetical protein